MVSIARTSTKAQKRTLFALFAVFMIGGLGALAFWAASHQPKPSPACIDAIRVALRNYTRSTTREPDDLRDIRPFLQEVLPGSNCAIDLISPGEYRVTIATSVHRYTVAVWYERDGSGRVNTCRMELLSHDQNP